MEEETKSLKTRLDELENQNVKVKEKRFKLPFAAKINYNKAKKGWISVAKINDNKTIEFVRTQIVDGTIKLESGDISFHAIDPEDIFYYKKNPFIFQAKRKLNPYNPLKGEHETYGQKYIMSRMEGDKLVVKKQMGNWIGWVMGALLIGVIVYAFYTA